MNIGIIVYSQTEHTFSVAQKLVEKLSADGHTVDVERVVPVGEVKPKDVDVTFREQPDTNPFDALIFGSPVHAFNLAPAMKVYLNQISSLQDKKIACFVTKSLPFDRTGGNQAIETMKDICQSKGGNILGSGIVNWSMSREKRINDLITFFSTLFSD